VATQGYGTAKPRIGTVKGNAGGLVRRAMQPKKPSPAQYKAPKGR
jgi:hypothetical protein